MEEIQDGIFAFQYNLASYLKDRFNKEFDSQIKKDPSLLMLMDYDTKNKTVRLYFSGKHDLFYDVMFLPYYRGGLNGFLFLGRFNFYYLGKELTKNQYYSEFLRVLKLIFTELYANRKFYEIKLNKSVITFLNSRITLLSNKQKVIYSY